MTMPNASSAATQKTRTVTAIFTANVLAQQQGAGLPVRAFAVYCPDGVPVGFEVPAEGEVASAGAVVPVPLAGTFSFWPTTILSVLRLFTERRALTVVPNWVAILVRLSPDLTVYISSLPEAPALEPVPAEGVPDVDEAAAGG